MSFIETIHAQLGARRDQALVTEVHGSSLVPADGTVLGDLIARARGALAGAGVKPGDRVVLIAPNSIRWVAAELGVLFHGAISVAMYDRQAPAELLAMIADCAPALLVVEDDALAASLAASGVPRLGYGALFGPQTAHGPPAPRAADDAVTIVYTSGTSGAAKGAVLTRANVDFMLPRTRDALAAMMGVRDREDRVFHYLPLCFAGSRIVLWTCLFRGSGIHLGTDLDRLATELATVDPHYLLNVPMLLERIKSGVEAKLSERGPAVGWLVRRATRAWERGDAAGRRDRLALALARRLVFSKVREKLGPSLECLICGSAPLAEHTQRWFGMIGLPVYQVYGLTETTAIVTMDVPPNVRPGRVGVALDGVELRVGDGDELLVRGPNVFAGYWGNPTATAEAIVDGWFRTGDQVELDGDGSLRIVGRVKNLLVPTSGHNVAPEPLEELLTRLVPGCEQAVVVGHGRPYLAAILAGPVDRARVEDALVEVNRDLPGYRRIRRWVLADGPFTVENGQLTANRKLRRAVIEAAYAGPIAALYG